MTSGERALLEVVKGLAEPALDAVVALVRDVREGASLETIAARSQRVLALQGFETALDLKAETKRGEIKAKGGK